MNLMAFPEAFFVTGTDTGIGKTVVSAILAAGLDAAYWKPVQSGLADETDTEWIKRVTQLPGDYFFEEAYRLPLPLSPHASAMAAGIEIEMNRFRLPQKSFHSHLIVEGAGGLMVPLNASSLMIDLMKQLGLPVLVVAKSDLGTINHTLLSVQKLRDYGLEVLGVVMNGKKNPGNRKAIEFYGKVRVCAEVEPLPDFSPKTLIRSFQEFYDIQEIEKG